MSENLKIFKIKCLECLSSFNVHKLRAYGRYLQLPKPSTIKKDELLNQIISVLCGEDTPERNKRGAPIKNDDFPPEILDKISKLQRKYFPESFVAQPEPEPEPVTNLREMLPLYLKENRLLPKTLELTLSLDVDKLNGNQKELLFLFLQSL